MSTDPIYVFTLETAWTWVDSNKFKASLSRLKSVDLNVENSESTYILYRFHIDGLNGDITIWVDLERKSSQCKNAYC